MNMSMYRKCLKDSGYALSVDGSIYRLDGKCIVNDVKLTMPDGHIVVINARQCNEDTLRYSNAGSNSKQTTNNQGDTMGNKRLTPMQCWEAWETARWTLKECGGSYTPEEKEELFKTILRDNGYDPDVEIEKMAETKALPIGAKLNMDNVLDMNVNHYLGTAAAIGRFLGKFGAYILIGAIWIFRAAVATVKALGRGIATALGAGAAEFTRALNERSK